MKKSTQIFNTDNIFLGLDIKSIVCLYIFKSKAINTLDRGR